MRFLLIAASSLSVLASPVEASRWVLVAEADSAKHFIDADAIVWDGQIASSWLRTEYSGRGPKEESAVLEKWMNDCENARSKLLAFTSYKADGSVLRSSQAPRYLLEWSEIKGGSTYQVAHQRICAQRPGGERG